MSKEYSKLTIKASQVIRAMDSVAEKFDDWQAQYLEVLLLPKVYKRWKQANTGHFDPEMLSIKRIQGLAHRGYAPKQNRAIGDAREWHKFAGYVLTYRV